ncbi:hypothetical protein [Actinoplanes sp. HUAS TT8]|uniref:hypothetical protein n=1 Tax=Actinoplanes sp. HUAS TT8 TaxID=3447453 RepID=UPI003F51E5B5
MQITSEVLRAAATDPASPAWETIWGQACHQGTCDPDSAALLPWLATTAAGFAGDQLDSPLALAGFITADATVEDRVTYAEEISALRALAAGRLPAASTDRAFVYLLQAILGLEGDETWGKELDRLNDGEADVRCPECDEETLLDIAEENPDIAPAHSSELAQRLHDEAIAAGRERVATAIAQLFGRLTCAECGTSFTIAENLAGASYTGR